MDDDLLPDHFREMDLPEDLGQKVKDPAFGQPDDGVRVQDDSQGNSAFAGADFADELVDLFDVKEIVSQDRDLLPGQEVEIVMIAQFQDCGR
ncbi:MAG: hypothetical protein PSX37_13485, partial [bacterium]|nr:hypothetical protein [bacterium]